MLQTNLQWDPPCISVGYFGVLFIWGLVLCCRKTFPTKGKAKALSGHRDSKTLDDPCRQAPPHRAKGLVTPFPIVVWSKKCQVLTCNKLHRWIIFLMKLLDKLPVVFLCIYDCVFANRGLFRDAWKGWRLAAPAMENLGGRSFQKIIFPASVADSSYRP